MKQTRKSLRIELQTKDDTDDSGARASGASKRVEFKMTWRGRPFGSGQIELKMR